MIDEPSGIHTCPGCFSNRMSVFHELDSVPVNSVLNLSTHESALNFARGKISLGFCRECGFISNVAFDPNLIEYSSNCEESQGYSPTFNVFLHKLASDLVEKYDLHGKEIIEIGCGKGEFLTLICRLGNNRGTGFDPTYVEGRDQHRKGDQLTFIKDFYSETYANYQGDFICCRMTLEHIGKTADLLSSIRHSIGNRSDTIIFFQVPDVTRILRECTFEDIYYEHCSYFSPGSLSRLFKKCGFTVLDLKTDYAGQYIMLEAKPGLDKTPHPLPLENDLRYIENEVTRFVKKHRLVIETWEKKLRKIREERLRVVIWGSSSKGVAFLTTLNIYDEVKYVVDINPFRQDTFMAGTGQRIVSPEFLKDYQPDMVIIMNPIYREEICRTLQNMGLHPQILSTEL